MKKLVLLVMIIVLMPFVFAGLLFDDWVEDKETFLAGDNSFYVRYFEATQKLSFKMNSLGGMMYVGECETQNEIKYCFEELNYPKIKVKISSLEPDISIERSFSTASPNLNEQVIVIVKLTNNGDKGASNVMYYDAYPAGLRVFSEKNAGEWQGNIAAGRTEEFRYSLRAEEIVSYDSIATVSYKFNGKEKTQKSSSISIKVKKPLSFTGEFSQEAADKNEAVTYNLTITNEDSSSKMDVTKIEINLDERLDLVSAKSDLKIEGKKLSFKGNLDKGQSKNLWVKVKADRVGTFKVSASANVEVGGKKFEENIEKTFNVGISDIMPILSINESVKSNSPYKLSVSVKNYGKEEIKNVNILVKSDLFSDMKDKKNIAAGSTYKMIDSTLTAPYAEEDKKYNIAVSGTYVSSSGKSYTFEKSAQMTVKAVPKIVEIVKEYNKEEAYLGDVIEVSVKVKNRKSENVEEIDVSDIFPKEIRSSLKGETTGYIGVLGPNEEKKVYSYSVTVPKDYKNGEIEFKTNLNVKVDGQLTILKKVDTIKIVKGEMLESAEEGKKTEIKDDEQQEKNETDDGLNESEVVEGEKGVFSKITNWIKNIFRKK
ncbi:MAG: hypothetical protein KKC75_03305 [Nanoarchaeota archaeon]|nr:hypothetical protein [Nanoarchaeota archaeon]MBU1004685.1 hypothetical protein [Nanoarchaeota archaeon]